MLSRVAGNLFWFGRYVDRTTNVARLADAARRIEAVPGVTSLRSSEWASALIAAGARMEGDGVLDVSRASAVHTLFFDVENPSSVVSCFRNARENARAVRVDLSQEVWEAINDTWLSYPNLYVGGVEPDLDKITSEVKGAGARIRGSINESLLHNDGFYFIKLGQALERIDSMARLIDVKYHVLLPDMSDVGSPVDRTHWQALLRASAAQRAYSYATKADVTARGVAQFLLLSSEFPRSVLFNARRLLATLSALERYYGADAGCRKEVVEFTNWIERAHIDDVFAHGLHELLTDIIEKSYHVAQALGSSYGFDEDVHAASLVVEQDQGQN